MRLVGLFSLGGQLVLLFCSLVKYVIKDINAILVWMVLELFLCFNKIFFFAVIGTDGLWRYLKAVWNEFFEFYANS